MDILDKKAQNRSLDEGSVSSKNVFCRCCGIDSHCRRRTFSEQAWSALLSWGEATVEAIDQPICNTCYQEMREILMERSDEIESKQAQSKDIVKKVKERLSILAS